MAREERIEALSYAVRFRVIGKYLGQLLLSVGLLTTAPLGVALYHSEQPASDRYLIVVARPLLAGAFMARIAGAKQVQNNQALVISALAFILVLLIISVLN
jgi:trk system potassium uptake protein TrkH